MKLSEAIRLGAMSTPQTYGRMWSAVTGGTCALGAAYYAVDSAFLTKEKFRASDHFPILEKNPVVKIPVETLFNTYQKLTDVIVFLNDRFYWSRERIADWVEIIEKEIELNEVQVITEPTTVLITVTT